jgi:hypothetical protein
MRCGGFLALWLGTATCSYLGDTMGKLYTMSGAFTVLLGCGAAEGADMSVHRNVYSSKRH